MRVPIVRKIALAAVPDRPRRRPRILQVGVRFG